MSIHRCLVAPGVPFLALLLLVSPPDAMAAPGTTDVKTHLGAAIPADVHLYARWENTPEQRPLRHHLAQAWDRLAASGILWDVFDLVTVELPERRRDEARQMVERVLGMLGKVSWGKLAGREVAMGVRFKIPFPEYLFLFRVAGHEVEEHLRGFRGLFQEVAQLAGPVLEVTESSEGDAAILSLSVQGGLVRIDVSHHGDVIALATTRPFLKSTLGFLSGKSAEGAPGAMADAPILATAARGMPPGRSAETVFRIEEYVEFYRSLLGMAGAATAGNEELAAVVGLANLLLDEVERLGTLVEFQWVGKDRVHTRDQLILRQDYREGIFYPVCADREPITEFGGIIPHDATAFHFSSGIDPRALHDLVIRLIRERVPRGERLLEKWGRVQDRIGFHLREDFLAWLDGQWGWMAFPVRAGSGTTSGCLLIVKLTDPELAGRKLMSGFRRLARYLEKRQQGIVLEPFAVGSETFRILRIDAFPDFRPVVGIVEKFLVLSCSAEAVKKVHAVAEEKAPRFIEGNVFREMGVEPGQPPRMVSYADIRNHLRDLSQIVTGAGFFLSILPEERDTRPLIKLGLILSKAGRFLREIDIGVKTASWTEVDEEGGRVLIQSVTTFKVAEPPPPRADL